jgi:HlyD family type I secretion membrane fusion protein
MSGLLQRSPSKAPKPRDGDQLPALISAFESETQAVIARTAPYSDRAILHGLAVLVVVSLLLMSVLEVDKVVTGVGRVAPTSGSLYVSPFDQGMVRAILVKVGDVVHKGQVMATLDPTLAGADATTLENKRASDAALVARLEAEQAGVPYAPKSANKFESLQMADWRQRQADYRSSLADFDARVASAATVQARAVQDTRDLDQHLQIATDLENRMLELEKSGYGATIKTLTARDTRIDAGRQLAEARNQAVQGLHDVASLRAQREVFVTKWRDDLATALVTARNDLNDSTQSLIKARRMHDLTSLTAPSDGVVLKIADASSGSVVSPQTSAAQPLFTLTPLAGPVEADIDIPARDVGFVKAGDKVRVKLDAYRYLAHGTAEGIVKSVSEGSFTTTDDNQPSAPYFKVRVAFTKVRLHNVPKDFRLIPGMTLQGDVLVGGRTIMSYLLEGGLRGVNEAMREP